MRRLTITLIVILFAPSLAEQANAVPFRGVEFPEGEVSFADEVVSYIPGPGVGVLQMNPEEVLGIPDGTDSEGYVSLGDEGELVLRFLDNSLTTSGDDAIDLWIFEVGSVEPTAIAISTDGLDWINVGTISGATSGVDIDAYTGDGVVLQEQYSYVKLTDLLPHTTGYPNTGADIDAVGAISSGPPIPEPATILFLAGGILVLRHRR